MSAGNWGGAAPPPSVEYCVIGGGVHGLSTAWHLAGLLKAKGRGGSSRVVLLDKKTPGSGASGIACGIVRNFYRSPAMTEMVRLSVEIWESDPPAFSYNPVGYLAIVPKPQVNDLIAIHKKQQEVGYCSELHVGEAACSKHMRGLWVDFNCDDIEAVLHESDGGFAVPKQTIQGLTRKAQEAGVEIYNGVEVTGFDQEADRVRAVETNRGRITTDAVVIGGGPWTIHFWKMLGLPMEVEVRSSEDTTVRKPMIKYWQLQIGRAACRARRQRSM